MNGRTSILDQALARLDAPPPSASVEAELWPASLAPPALSTLSGWFQSLIQLHSTVECGERLIRKALETVVESGLDGAQVLMDGDPEALGNQDLSPVIRYPKSTGAAGVSSRLLDEVRESKQTIFHNGVLLASLAARPTDVTWVVSPLFDDSSDVVGFLIAWRSQDHENQRLGIRTLEAHFVQLVARTVSVQLIRQERETEIAEKNTLLAQAFPPKVVRALHDDPSILQGRQQTVTVLYADLRGFSSLVDQFSAQLTYDLVADVMDSWTELAISQSGAIVDYFGDGLVAFWNAPLEVENHAALAVTCARKMLERLGPINESWYATLGRSLTAGFGIATGWSRVGNCGSRHRFKYGPHGAPVHLAARLEKLTKELGLSILISDEAAGEIEADYLVRRVCRASVPGFEQAVDVYHPVVDELDFSFLEQYEQALLEYEIGNVASARSRVERLLLEQPADRPTQLLHERLNLGPVRNDRGSVTFLRANGAGRT